jgi:hypothetical protein
LEKVNRSNRCSVTISAYVRMRSNRGTMDRTGQAN